MFKSLAFSALLAATSARKCQELIVPVSLTAQNAVFDLDTPTSKIDITNLALNLARQPGNYPSEIMDGMAEVSGDYELGVTYCEPDAGPGSQLQILTHGIGFDRSYWDFPFNDFNYSYVERAVEEHGYSTLTWDRLGIGASSKGDPVKEIQIFLEIAALAELTTLARTQRIQGVNTNFSRIVHAGHSFGAAMTYGLANQYPDITDAIILQGYTQSTDYLSHFALGSNFIPVKESPLADKYPEGYVAVSSAVSVHVNFFAQGEFDPVVLSTAYVNGQPTTPGELLTLAAPGLEINNFTGPVLVVTGDRDVPFCGGNCTATSSVNGTVPTLLDISEEYFPNAVQFNTTVIPRAGHGLNLEYTAQLTYDAMFEFLSS